MTKTIINDARAKVIKETIESVFETVVMGQPDSRSEFDQIYVTHKLYSHIHTFDQTLDFIRQDMLDRRAKKLVWRVLPDTEMQGDYIHIYYRFHTMPDDPPIVH